MSMPKVGTKVRGTDDVPGYGTPAGVSVGTVIENHWTEEYRNWLGTDDEFAVEFPEIEGDWYYYRASHEGVTWEVAE